MVHKKLWTFVGFLRPNKFLNDRETNFIASSISRTPISDLDPNLKSPYQWLNSIPFKLAAFFATEWKPYQCNKTTLSELNLAILISRELIFPFLGTYREN